MSSTHVFNVKYQLKTGTIMVRMINATNSREAREKIKMGQSDLTKIIAVVKVR